MPSALLHPAERSQAFCPTWGPVGVVQRQGLLPEFPEPRTGRGAKTVLSDPPVLVPLRGVPLPRGLFVSYHACVAVLCDEARPARPCCRRQAALAAAERAEKPIRSAVQEGYDVYPTALQNL